MKMKEEPGQEADFKSPGTFAVEVRRAELSRLNCSH